MRAWLSWSSGKDSAWSLHVLRSGGEVEVAGLLTTFNEAADRVAMHAVRRELVVAQAREAGVPLVAVGLPWPCDNATYRERMAAACDRARSDGIEAIAFGDLFLEDIRRYREEQLAPTGLEPLFPLWGRPTDELAREMTAAGMESIVTCVDPKQLDPSFAGRTWDRELLRELPPGVDPCGENGEFHTFACAGPMFARPVPVRAGDVVERDGFHYADLSFAG